MPRKKQSTRSKKKKNNDESRFWEFGFLQALDTETWIDIISILLFVFGLIVLLALLGLAGGIGILLKEFLASLFGWLIYLLPLVLFVFGYLFWHHEEVDISLNNYIGITIFFLSLSAILNLFLPPENLSYLVSLGQGGGYAGYILGYPLIKGFGKIATVVILLALFLLSFIIMFNMPLRHMLQFRRFWAKIRGYEFDDEEEEEEEDEEEVEEEEEEGEEEDEEPEKVSRLEKIKAKVKLKRNKQVTIPEPKVKFKNQKIDLPVNLLDMKAARPTSGNIKNNSYVIKKTLDDFKIKVKMGDVQVGPAVTQFTLRPADGVKLNKIKVLSDDLALALAAHPIRIEAPIPGKSLVGIEVPNEASAIVRLREIIESPAFKKRKSDLSIALGKDVGGNCWVADIAKMPHLLVAGATGSGKSVCLNSMIISLLYQNTPETLRFIMVDPKRVELAVYNEIPHLLTPVINDVKKTINALKWALVEMDRRYKLLATVKKRNIASFNASSSERMPYIVIIIDELADLMVAASSEIESLIIRLAQMARAVGIHLILATQRPSVDVITGLIKANVPARIAFSVASVMDSRTILDSAGADKLVGNGDMLFVSPDFSKPRRIQGPYVSDDEIKRIVDFLHDKLGEPEFNEEIMAKQKGGTFFNSETDDGDDLYDEARLLVVQEGRASTSFLQRKLRVGYARAARIMDLLEEGGVVGPADGAKPRDILITMQELSSLDTYQIDDDSGTNEEEPEEDTGEYEDEENEDGDEEEFEEDDDRKKQ